MGIVEGCIMLITANIKGNGTSPDYAFRNWCYYFHLLLSNTKDVSSTMMYLAPAVGCLLENVSKWLPSWISSLGDPSVVEDVCGDLGSVFKNVKKQWIHHIYFTIKLWKTLRMFEKVCFFGIYTVN